jgi:threonyl-tRNA synthetase
MTTVVRLLIWHVDAFTAEPTTRGRSPLADASPETVSIGEGVVVFAACEQADEVEPEEAATRATRAIVAVAKQLGAQTIVLHSFAHLFVELASPAPARELLGAIQAQLTAQGYSARQTAFGWFNRLDLKAKGHPYSRIARQV